jgi:hypothetical protein
MEYDKLGTVDVDDLVSDGYARLILSDDAGGGGGRNGDEDDDKGARSYRSEGEKSSRVSSSSKGGEV